MGKVMRILLVQPEYLTAGIGFRLAALPEPLHLEMVAALVPEHTLRILDLRLEDNLQGTLAEFRPDIVAVTALTPEVYAAQAVVRHVKAFSPEIFTVVGGHHASLQPDDFLIPEVDAVAIGEAEMVFPGLIRNVLAKTAPTDVPNLIWQDRNGQFIRNHTADAAANMDTFPFPRRDLTAAYRDRYSFIFHRPDTSVTTARGCPYRCNFCSVWKFHNGRTRMMSPRRVLAELTTIRTRHVTFVDDNFLLDHRREDSLADLIKAEGLGMQFSMECRTDSIARHPHLVRKWVDIGLVGVLLGLEGASDQMLNRVNKQNTAKINDRAIEILQELDVMIWGAFIVDPDWTEDDFKRLRDYVSQKKIAFTQFTILTPLPGTDLYRDRFHDLLTHDYSCFDTMHSVLPTRLPREVFYQQFANLYRQTDLSPYYDLVKAGRMTIEDCRYGKTLLDAASKWEGYLENDPILGRRDNAVAQKL
ncbi:MAG: radical SAM protein [Planctomycetota bacterium]|nr:radical SAM protein [Planctomycetota bacterium]